MAKTRTPAKGTVLMDLGHLLYLMQKISLKMADQLAIQLKVIDTLRTQFPYTPPPKTKKKR
jgi:hypothetical protein